MLRHAEGVEVGQAPASGHGSTERALFVRVTDPEDSLPGGGFVTALRAELSKLAPAGPASTLDALVSQARGLSEIMGDAFEKLLDEYPDEAVREVQVRRALLACAPLTVQSGAWLQWLSGPANAESPIVLDILSLYADDVGVGHPRASRGSAYVTLMRTLRLADNATPTSRLAIDERISDEAFYLPSILLAMGRRPDELMAELLGADLCLRSIGLLPPLGFVRATRPTGPDWAAMDLGDSRGPEGRTGFDASLQIARQLSSPAEHDAVVLGFGWAMTAVTRFCDNLLGELRAAAHPAFEMAELMRLRAREGSVYHQQFQLEGRSLSSWLHDCQRDPVPFLDVIARSRLIKPGCAERSPLVNGLISERGPMFRVFSPEDIAVITAWIDSLPGTAAGPTPVRARLRFGSDLDPAAHLEPSPTPASIRDAYHRLHTRSDDLGLRSYALDYVESWLARSAQGLDATPNQLPPTWDPRGLRPWLATQHDRHGAQFEESANAPLPTRQDLVTSTIQLAPLTLIDGGWLRGFCDYEHASSEIGYSLFETYWDELGNGIPALNHPIIYRQVLAEMGVVVPPTGSRDFADWTGFDDTSFELPVYWLCIGRFPQTFMPEVLGLNLAMELSGVGGTYRRARVALKSHGFSTRFVDIHNTIDNVATGHSAWAADAVDTYLASVACNGGAASQAALWQRVRVGYRSLNPPSGFRARQAARRARSSSRAR